MLRQKFVLFSIIHYTVNSEVYINFEIEILSVGISKIFGFYFFSDKRD